MGSRLRQLRGRRGRRPQEAKGRSGRSAKNEKNLSRIKKKQNINPHTEHKNSSEIRGDTTIVHHTNCMTPSDYTPTSLRKAKNETKKRHAYDMQNTTRTNNNN